MRADRTRLDPRTRLSVPRVPVIQSSHPLADRLRHCWIPEWTRGQDRIRNLFRSPGETPVADFNGTAPVWAPSMVGSAALSFDGVARQLLHPNTPDLLWNPFLMGGVAYTVAYVGRMKSFGTTGKVLYSHNSSSAGVISLELSVRNSRFDISATQDALSGESVGCSLTTLPRAGNLFAVIGTIRDPNNSAIAMRDYQAGTRASASDAAGNISSFFVNTVDQESFGSWHGGGSIDANSFADTDMLGVFGWNRALSDVEMQQFLDDPFGVLREKPRPKYISSSIAAPGTTLATTWSLSTADPPATGETVGRGTILFTTWSLKSPGAAQATNGPWTFADSFVTFDNPNYNFAETPANADAVAGGQTLTTTWSVMPSVTLGGALLTTQWSLAEGTATGVANPTGATLSTQWFLLPGQANGANAASGVTLSTQWSVQAGTTTGSNTAPGKDLMIGWSLISGSATSSTPTPQARAYFGGGGFGPGGDPAAMARIRQTVERAADKAFDLDGWTKAEAEKAAATMREAVQKETERTRPERMRAAVTRFLGLTED